MKKKALLFSLILAPFFAVIFISIHLMILFYTPQTPKETLFTIKPGEGFSSINYRLAKDNLISNARLFHYYMKFTGNLQAFKANTYNIPAGLNMGEVAALLMSGKAVLAKVTIPEGKNMYEIGKILEEQGITTYKGFIQEAKNKEYQTTLKINAPSLEGYLFADTYYFAPKSSPKTVVRTMLDNFQNKTKNLDFSKTSLTPYEVVTLASIVEKETGAKFERKTIAGVYLNRLNKRMRLQADPTTIYGIWETYNGNLKKKHLLQKTPYNTYKISGLPLGPICSPSLKALEAVLEPQPHNYLYFVSKNDGTHVFTPTYKEHAKAVNYWQKNRKRRQGKSWRDLKQN